MPPGSDSWLTRIASRWRTLRRPGPVSAEEAGEYGYADEEAGLGPRASYGSDSDDAGAKPARAPTGRAGTEEETPLVRPGSSGPSDPEKPRWTTETEAPAAAGPLCSPPILCGFFFTLIIFLVLTVLKAKAVNDRNFLGDGLELRPKRMAELVSNGTVLFAPTTVLISLDGFRPDFLRRGITPNLAKLAADPDGLSPEYMTPSFPSLTFPNHHSIATGLFPESHGIVSNSFWDTDLNEMFTTRKPSKIVEARWWGGEPIWRTAEKHDVRTAMLMWPGSEIRTRAAGRLVPTIVDKFKQDTKLEDKARRLLGLLDIPGPDELTVMNSEGGTNGSDPIENAEWTFPSEQAEEKPQFIGMYVPNVDAAAHPFGPNSPEVDEALKYTDNMIGMIVRGLERRNLTGIVNLVIVSDHGMAGTSAPSNNQTVKIDDLVDSSRDLGHIIPDGYPLAGLWPSSSTDAETVLAKVRDGLNRVLPDGHKDAIKAYHRDVDMPAKYHYSSNKARIAPVWLVPEPGWTLLYPTKRLDEIGKGLHGYDPANPLMRALFLATGPAFNRTAVLNRLKLARPGPNVTLADFPPVDEAPRKRPGPGPGPDRGFFGSAWDSVTGFFGSLFGGSDDDGEGEGGDDQAGPPAADEKKPVGKLAALPRPRPFRNVNVYSFVCESLGVPPSANNGTLSIDDLVAARM